MNVIFTDGNVRYDRIRVAWGSDVVKSRIIEVNGIQDVGLTSSFGVNILKGQQIRHSR